MNGFYRAVVVPLLLGFCCSAVAETERPKIGLALSGGGSKAGAHIGVLRVLEANNIPVDFIAGTSAGSIIGGLYAAGLSPDEIEAAVGGIDWGDILQDAPPRPDLPFRRKRDDLNYLVKYRPGYRDGALRLPLGIVQGQKVTNFLRRHVDDAATTDHFDTLPIPLRVVATDLETGEAVVLEQGDLALSIRASMAIPVFFSPISIDGRQLVDGGPANNLPVDVVREMGADVVIAVDITAPLLEKEAIDSVLVVADQLTNMLTQRTVREQVANLREGDILIRPDLSEVGGLDFERTLDSVPPGMLAAEAALPRLRQYSLEDPAFAAHLNRRSATDDDVRHFAFIDINNRSQVETETIRHRLGLRLGAPIERDEIEKGIANVYALDLFARIDYRFETRDEGEGIVVDVMEKPWGPSYLQFGMRLSEDFSTDSDFNIGIAYLQTAVNELGGEWRAQLDLGDLQGLSLNWFQPLSRRSRIFTEFDAFVRRRNFRFFDERSALADLRVSGWGLRAAAGAELGVAGEVRFGWNRFKGDADVVVGDLEITNDNFDIGEFFTSVSYDRLDNANFPQNGASGGIRAVWSSEGAGADSNYEQIAGTVTLANTWGRFSLLGGVEFGTTLDDDAPLQSQFQLGGLGRLSGYPANRFLGQHYGLANLTAYTRLNRNVWLPLYAGVSVEVGNVWNDLDDIDSDSLRVGGALYAGTESPLGPVYLAVGLAEGAESTIYLYLGNPFNLQGARPLDQ